MFQISNPRYRRKRSCSGSGLRGYELERLRLLNAVAESNLPEGTVGRRPRYSDTTRVARIRGHIQRLDALIGQAITDFGNEEVIAAPIKSEHAAEMEGRQARGEWTNEHSDEGRRILAMLQQAERNQR